MIVCVWPLTYYVGSFFDRECVLLLYQLYIYIYATKKRQYIDSRHQSNYKKLDKIVLMSMILQHFFVILNLSIYVNSCKSVTAEIRQAQ